MTYIVTARKWRPMVFDDVVGQSHVTITLRNAIASNRISHSYIFSGPRGCGKTTTARLLAKAINCLHPKDSNPDNACDLCKEITEGRSVNVFEIDGASNRGIEDVRNLREAVRYPPAKGKYKVYIIDEVHMLTKEAFNALLKTLEEPPPHVLFIFATTEIHKVPLTILSRCQRFDFRRNTIDDIIGRLTFISKEEGITIDHDSLLVIAKKADGSMRDAQSIFDQIVSFCGTTIAHRQIVETLNLVDEEFYFRVTDLIRAKNPAGALGIVEEVIGRGYDLREFLNGLNEHFRNLLVARTTGSTDLIEASEAYKKRYQEEMATFSVNDLLRLVKITMETENSLRWTQQPRYKLEMALMHMTKMDGSVRIDELLQQVQELKKKLTGQTADPPRKAFPAFPEKPSEAPIRGSVKATPPALRPDQVVSHHPTALAAPAFSKNEPPPLAAAPLIPVLSTDEALGKWPAFVDEARRERVILGTMLGESRFVGVVDNRVRVGCPDGFHLDEFKRNRDYLNQLAQRVYGAKVRLEGILSDITPRAYSPSDPTGPKNGNGRTIGPDILQHPVVQAIIREFGAEEME